MPNESDDLDLSGLTPTDGGGGDGDEGMTEQELKDHGRDLVWLAGDMAPPEDIAHSLHRLDAGLGELLEVQERQADAVERIAVALEKGFATLSRAFPA